MKHQTFKVEDLENNEVEAQGRPYTFALRTPAELNTDSSLAGEWRICID